jgi:hypothetical protein
MGIDIGIGYQRNPCKNVALQRDPKNQMLIDEKPASCVPIPASRLLICLLRTTRPANICFSLHSHVGIDGKILNGLSDFQ